ncbi:MAG TPA: hypothetical protein VGF25_21525 [Thermoleophilaceae bacterium]
MTRIMLAAAAVAVAVMLLPSGSTAQTPLPHAKVGKVERTRAYIGLSYDDGRVRVYVCNGTSKRSPTISKWFKGRWDGESPLTLGRRGPAVEIEEVHADGRVTGHLHWRGSEHDFTLRRATGPAGLYERKKAEGGHRPRGSWVFLADRSFRGAMVDPRPRKCRPVQVTLANGTTQIVTVCKSG